MGKIGNNQRWVYTIEDAFWYAKSIKITLILELNSK